VDLQRWTARGGAVYRFSGFTGFPSFQVSGFSRYGLQYSVTLSLGLAVASASLFSHYWVSGLNPSAPFGKSSA
jgi:hypothetical protein